MVMRPELQNSTGVSVVWLQPVTGSQESDVQLSPSLQGFGAYVQAPVAGVHESIVQVARRRS